MSKLDGIASVLRVLPFVIVAVIFIGYKVYFDHNPNVMKFLLVTDIHLDTQYDPAAPVAARCRPLSVHAFARDASDQPLDFMSTRRFAGANHAVTPDPLPNEFNSSGIYGRVGCDSPYILLQSTLQQMRLVEPNPDFILLLGDFVAHHENDPRVVMSILANVTATIHAAFPTARVLPVIGNNDVSPDYQVDLPPASWLDFLATTWSVWLTEDNQNTMRQGGYYNTLLVPGLRLLGLNTVYWSSYWANETGGVTLMDDPAGQFAWLETQLQNALNNNERVIITGHIPPGQNQFDNIPLWRPQYVDRYMSITMQPQFIPVITHQLFSHFHRDTFRVMYTNPAGQQQPIQSLLMAPSVSPVNINNPSFRHVKLDKKRGLIVDYDEYYMDLFMSNLRRQAVWLPAYTFSSTYNSKGAIDTSLLGSIVTRLQTDPNFYALWVSRKEVFYFGERAEESRYSTLCAVQTIRNDEYVQCLQRGGYWPPSQL